ALGEPLRVLLDTKPGKAAAKRWDWVRKGAPVIIEVGPRDMDNGVVSLLRRDALWDEATGKPAFANPTRDAAVADMPALLAAIQQALFDQALANREANVVRDIDTVAGLAEFFGEDRKYPGWVEVQWAKPTGAALEGVVETLKELKLTLRNVPIDAAPVEGKCVFTGEPAVERVYVARAY
ncbi:MAG: proline--tRNA ligase, partial [Erythrobacter sp.]|nr:proline--tRNA ligase [Erythrobacter sp.]